MFPVHCLETDATGCGKDIAVSLCLTQQFDSFLRVGHGDYAGSLDGLERDLNYVAVQTVQRQRIACNDVVLNDEMHQRLLIVVAVSDG